MRFNETALGFIASTAMPDNEGNLKYRPGKESPKDRWFKLKGNLLFYFRTNEYGQLLDNNAIGLLVIENCTIKREQFIEGVVFSITFEGEREKSHYFSCQNEAQCNTWVTKLKNASYNHLKNELSKLQADIIIKTGKDPLLDTKLVPKQFPTSCGAASKFKASPSTQRRLMNISAQSKEIAGKLFDKVKSAAPSKDQLLRTSNFIGNWETFD